jgi:hypothetical protein
MLYIAIHQGAGPRSPGLGIQLWSCHLYLVLLGTVAVPCMWFGAATGGVRSRADARILVLLPCRLSTPLSGLDDQSRTCAAIMPAMPIISSNTPAGCI